LAEGNGDEQDDTPQGAEILQFSHGGVLAAQAKIVQEMVAKSMKK
jgi:hypothetical protein